MSGGVFSCGLGVVVAWRPFVDPIDIHGAWWLLLAPLALGIAVVYKAVRLPTLEGYWRQVAMMTGQIVVAMILLAVAVHALVEVYVRVIAEWSRG